MENSTFLMNVPLNNSVEGLCQFDGHDGKSYCRLFDEIWYKILLLIVSLTGIAGNTLSLIVLTRHRMLRRVNRMERSGNYCLIALALSDICFCVAQLPEAINPSDCMWHPVQDKLVLYSKMYGEAVRDTFMALSAWIMVIISINRLIAVTIPLRARNVLTGVKTSIGIAIVSVLSILITLPSYLHFNIVLCQAHGVPSQHVEIEKAMGTEEMWTIWLHYRLRISPILATFMPFGIMVFCNLGLILTLRRASSRRRVLTANDRQSGDVKNKMTATLLSVVVMFMILVLPMEIVLYDYTIFLKDNNAHLFDKIFNIAKAFNFSCNFFLYVMVNAKFRMILRSLIPCCKAPSVTINRSGTSSIDRTSQSFIARTSIKMKQTHKQSPRTELM